MWKVQKKFLFQLENAPMDSPKLMYAEHVIISKKDFVQAKEWRTVGALTKEEKIARQGHVHNGRIGFIRIKIQRKIAYVGTSMKIDNIIVSLIQF